MAVHPTPLLRPLISIELLQRMNFAAEAEESRRLWMRTYPTAAGNIPEVLLRSFPTANRLVVETIVFTPYGELGGKTLAQAVMFGEKEQQATRAAARLLADGRDPRAVPARFLIGAARCALDQRMAPPREIAENFYRVLERR
jgi:hypothetical protein